ncbi:MAG: tryptophan synthase subunit alpha [Elusimicrobiota bacterium]
MTSISQKFAQLRAEKKKALIAFITAGYPDLEATTRYLTVLEKAGVDIAEIGVPFSDPSADGPTIQYSSQKALEKGISLPAIFAWIKKIRPQFSLPLVLMSYYNPIYQLGKKLIPNIIQSEVQGLIIPDLPPDEEENFQKKLEEKNIDLIFLLAPTSNQQRIKLAAEKSKGFIYVVSLTGVTGARSALSPQVKSLLQKIRRYTDKPLALGFGISRPEQVQPLRNSCDGIIIGSALIEIIRQGGDVEKKLADFLKPFGEILG